MTIFMHNLFSNAKYQGHHESVDDSTKVPKRLEMQILSAV